MHDNPHSPEPRQTPRRRAATPGRIPKRWDISRWLAIACPVLGFVVGYLVSAPAESSHQRSVSVKRFAGSAKNFVGLPEAEPMPARPSSLLVPVDTRSPKQVVEIQMGALSAYRHNRAAIHQVFAHASPVNQAVTGPLEKFEQMILQPQFHALVASQHNLVGQAVQRGKVATVLVTTVDEQGRMSVFRFILSIQSNSYPGCWMTDGVFCLVGKWRPGEALPVVERKLLDTI